jgi:hypothetical protein
MKEINPVVSLQVYLDPKLRDRFKSACALVRQSMSETVVALIFQFTKEQEERKKAKG